MRRIRGALDHLTYANVVATLALFIALGGASYAAVALPPRSVGPPQLKTGAVSQRALGFPLGVTSASDERREAAPRTRCNGGAVSRPGEVPPPCPPVVLSAPGAPQVHLRLTSAGELVLSAVLAVADEGSSTASVRLGLLLNNRQYAVQKLSLSAGQALEDPLEAVVPADAGEHVVGLGRVVEYTSAGTGSVYVGPDSLAVTALPLQSASDAARPSP